MVYKTNFLTHNWLNDKKINIFKSEMHLKLKKINFLYITLILIAGLLSCKKKDISPPNISVLGDSAVNVYLYEAYIDSGIVFSDDKSNVYVDTMTNLKTDSMGTYYFRYVVTDIEGNFSVFSREINVKLNQDNLLGEYNLTETISSGPGAEYSPYGPYPATILKGNTPNKILIANFAGYTSEVKAEAVFTDSGEITIPSQVFADGTLSGSGMVTYNANKIMFAYEYVYDLGTDIGEITAIKK